jgi:alpha-beta hydrolase superfamily lysophospholipase
MSDQPDTIVLIHGMWMTPLSWERWIDRYTGRGYRVIAPPWPGMEDEIEELRRDPSPIARLGVSLLGNLASNHKALRMTANSSTTPSPTRSPSRSRQRRTSYYVPAARHVLLEGALANVNPHSALRVDYGKRDRAPLLLIAGGKDHTIPASITRATAERYGRSNASVAYKEFPDRSHYTLGQDGWEEVADYALAWAQTATGQ